MLVIALVLMLIGMIGVIVPVVPGLLVVWAVAVGTTLLVDTDATGWVLVLVFTVLFAIGTAATVALPARRGRRGGAPRSSLLAAIVGAVIGFFALPVLGLLVGAGAGFLLAERQRLDDWSAALRSLGEVLRAYGVGVLIELALGVVLIGTWLVAALLR